MSRARLIIITTAAVIFFAALGIYFTVSKNTPEAVPQNQIPSQQFDFVKEDQAQVQDSAEYFETFGVGKLKVTIYGGEGDIRTSIQGGNEYALIRNPKDIGGLEFSTSNSYGDFYFAIDGDGNKILFPEGSPDGKFGYNDVGEASGELIREKIPDTEYYAAYPTNSLAQKSGFQAIGDEGSSSRFLGTKYLKITNLNNNRQVIVEIDSRNTLEDTLLVSEATRRALMIDNGALGSFSLEIISPENNTLGVVRR
jgi:hypothetical protein